MDIKTLLVETDRHISETVCRRLNESGFQTECVSYDKYCTKKEKYVSHDLIIYMVGKDDKRSMLY